MQLSIDIDVSRVIGRFDKMLPDVHDALLKALKPLAEQGAKDARDLADEHIHFIGKKPGMYLASIYGGVADKGSAVIGYIRSASPLAHLLEYGASIPAHEIGPDTADALAFEGDAGMVFAKVIHSPGATVPAYPAIKPALTAIADQVEQVLRDAAKGAVVSYG